MNRTEKLVYSLLTILLVANLGATGLFYQSTVSNQYLITQNQQLLADGQETLSNDFNVLVDYLSILAGSVLENPDTEVKLDIHLRAWVHDKDGNLKQFSEHAGVLTTIGKNYIEDQLGDSPNATNPADWISLSNDAGAPSSAWTEIPNEIVANNMSRAQGTYASTGDGSWTITYKFTASGAQSVQLAGLNWAGGPCDNVLLCADQITSASLVDDDTLTLEWTITAS
jgi:hypothetical protein